MFRILWQLFIWPIKSIFVVSQSAWAHCSSICTCSKKHPCWHLLQSWKLNLCAWCLKPVPTDIGLKHVVLEIDHFTCIAQLVIKCLCSSEYPIDDCVMHYPCFDVLDHQVFFHETIYIYQKANCDPFHHLTHPQSLLVGRSVEQKERCFLPLDLPWMGRVSYWW